jgi:hypothetical protein
MMRFNLLVRPAFRVSSLCLALWGTTSSRRDDQRVCSTTVAITAKGERVAETVTIISTNTAAPALAWTPATQASARLRVDDAGNTSTAGRVAHGSTCWPCCFRGSPRSAQQRLPDNLDASIAPVSRGQIGLAAASYVLAVQESIPQHGRYGEPNIVTSAPKPSVLLSLCCGPIFGGVLTLSPCRTWQSCTQSHRHQWSVGR